MNFRRALQLEHVYFQRAIAVSSLLCHKNLGSAVSSLTDPEFCRAIDSLRSLPKGLDPVGLPDLAHYRRQH